MKRPLRRPLLLTSRMDPQRRTALVSVGAAVALIALKLGAGLPSHSLGLISEAARARTHLVRTRPNAVEATWYVLAGNATVIVLAFSPTWPSWRASRRYRSESR